VIGKDRQNLVAVNRRPVGVDRQHPVSVAVERDAEIEVASEDCPLEERQIRAPQPTLMFVPSGSAPIAVTSAPSCSKACGAIAE